MKVTAMFAYRYEPDWMIDQLRENLAWVDAFAEYDTRDATELWVPVEQRSAKLREIAKALDSEWLLYVAPDERLQRGAENLIRSVIQDDPRLSYALRLREMFTPTAYRVDGVWGRKKRRRLYHIDHADKAIKPIRLDLNLYHLKMVEPENRALRVKVFEQANTWDNKSRGFAYLNDDTGTVLQEIPAGREYDPPYRRYDFRVPEHLLT